MVTLFRSPHWKKWYIQSHLVRVPTLIVGRHEEGVLRSTERIQVEDIARTFPTGGIQPEYARLQQTLRRIRSVCAKDAQSDRIWRVITNKSGSPIIEELSSAEIAGINRDSAEQRVGVLPRWFIDEFDTFREQQLVHRVQALEL